MWGFFVTVDTQIDQYGSYQYTVTKEMIENAKKAMAKYPKKPNLSIIWKTGRKEI